MVCAASALAVGSAAFAQEASAPLFDREAWLKDYSGLKEAMARGYANLDWIVERRGLDLPALDRTITGQLQAARTEHDAVEALKAFLTAFGDPHLAPRRGRAHEASLRNAAGLPQRAESDEPAASDEPRSQSCAELGYQARAHDAAFDPAALPEWKPLESAHFAAGGSGRIALVRIPSFEEKDYPAACEAGWQPGRTERETQLATRAVLQSELIRLASELKADGAEVLALDLTGNGGGSEWSEEAAALFTDREITRPSPRLVEVRCDRSGVWRGEAVCSNLSPEAGIDRLAGQAAWHGPLAVLVDQHSASAAEDFAYWLAGSGVARLVGERTFGAGCGYMDGGWAFQLSAFDAHVMMPNCSRYTADGVNQIEGLQPDVAYDWSAGVAGLPDALTNSAG